MANEYQLSYTAEQINNKLGKIDKLSEEIVDLSWSDLGEKQGFGDTLTWDGNIEGYETIVIGDSDGSVYLVKLSDAMPTLEELLNGTSFVIGNDVITIKNAYDDGNGSYSLTCVGDSSNAHLPLFQHTEITFNGATISPGIYYPFIPGDDYMSSLTINGFNGFERTEIKKIPAEYLPKGRSLCCDLLVNLIFDEEGNAIGYDKTYDEIYTFIKADKDVWLYDGTVYLKPNGYSNHAMYFRNCEICGSISETDETVLDAYVEITFCILCEDGTIDYKCACRDIQLI